jgi:hypothetical protein
MIIVAAHAVADHEVTKDTKRGAERRPADSPSRGDERRANQAAFIGASRRVGPRPVGPRGGAAAATLGARCTKERRASSNLRVFMVRDKDRMRRTCSTILPAS